MVTRSSPERRRLFRMIIPKYPAFNIYSHVAKKTTALGPICVATTVSRMPGWDVEVIDENNYRFPGPIDDQGAPDHAELQSLRTADAVGLYGGLSCTVPRLNRVAAFYRRAGIFAVGGGHHLDALPEESLRAGLDVVVNGEGEETIAEVLAARFSGGTLEELPGVSLLREDRLVRNPPRPPMEEFEHLPLPDFGLLRFARVSVYPVSRIRGCGMHCEFCAVKGKARCASPERLMAQIRYLAEGHRAREFFVVDDQFAQDREETLRLCRMLRDYMKRMGLKFYLTVQIRLDCARDEELLAAMHEAGIRCLAIGIESPVEEELVAMGKHLRVDEMVELARIYHRSGFLVHGMFIFGYPMQPGVEFGMDADERVKRYRRFFHKAQLDTVQVLLPVPLPGTALRDRLMADGRVFSSEEVGWEYYDGNFPLFVPDEPLSPESMHLSTRRLMSRFYRFGRMLRVLLHVLRFPVAMLPLVNLRSRWSKWHRHWRNDVVGSAGYFVVKRWQKALARGPFNEKLSRATRK